jgi:SNF2 family DNA or RNA helicase
MLSKLATEYAGGQILAVNEAVKVNKLIQIACGVAYGANGDEVYIPSTPRLEVLKEVIEASEGKVIVFVPLTGALEAVATEIRKDFTAEVVHGATSKSERDRIFAAFQKTSDPRVLVANAATMSHGLTLTAATTIVWYAPVHSNEIYEQACARVRRPGQTKTTLIVHIAGSDVERRVYKRLRDKQSLQGLVLEMMEDKNTEH